MKRIIKKETLKNLISECARYWRTGDIDILDGAIEVARVLEDQFSYRGELCCFSWTNYKSLVDNYLMLDLSEDEIITKFKELGFEFEEEINLGGTND